MAYTPDRVKQINAAREANVNSGISAYAGAGATELSSSILGQSTPFNITNPVPATKNIGLQGFIGSATTSDIATADKNAQLQADMAKSDSSLKAYTDAVSGAQSQSQITADASGQTNELGTTVNQTADAVKKINNEITAAQFDAQKQIEHLNGLALTDTQKQQQAREINRVATSQQADLYIKKLALHGDYESAKGIADRFVDAKFEEQKNKIEAAKITYIDNKDKYTKAEQRQYEASLDKQKRSLDLAADLEKMKYKATLDARANGVAPVEAGKYGTALSVILGSDKFTDTQRKAITQSINNGGDPVAVIKNQAKNIMGQTEATTLTKYEVARDTLSDIGNQLSQFYAAGGSTNIFSGNFEKAINKLGDVKDPNLVNLATQIQGNLQVYRNAISGTAYSAQEGKDISSIFPGINKTQGLNEAILRGRSTLFDSVIDSTYRSALGSSYDSLKAGEKPKTAAPTSGSDTHDYNRVTYKKVGNQWVKQ